MDATLESEDAEEGYNQRPVTDRTGARDWRGRSAVLSGQAVSQEAGYEQSWRWELERRLLTTEKRVTTTCRVATRQGYMQY